MSPWGLRPGLQTTAKVTGLVLESLGCWMEGPEEREPNSHSLPSAPSYSKMGIATSLFHSALS